jgi:hypothetical protein
MVLGSFSEVEQDMLEDALEFCFFVVPQDGECEIGGLCAQDATPPFYNPHPFACIAAFSAQSNNQAASSRFVVQWT